jgi:organic hydroperoxide reductase OsmC/OhrA
MKDSNGARVTVIGSGGRNGIVHAEGVLSAISFGAPSDHPDEPTCWTPEHFLIAAVASCFISTFSDIAEKTQLEITSFILDAELVLGTNQGVHSPTRINLRPIVSIIKEQNRNEVIQLLEQSARQCSVAQSLRLSVVVFPVVEIRGKLSVSATI